MCASSCARFGFFESIKHTQCEQCCFTKKWKKEKIREKWRNDLAAINMTKRQFHALFVLTWNKKKIVYIFIQKEFLVLIHAVTASDDLSNLINLRFICLLWLTKKRTFWHSQVVVLSKPKKKRFLTTLYCFFIFLKIERKPQNIRNINNKLEIVPI